VNASSRILAVALAASVSGNVALALRAEPDHVAVAWPVDDGAPHDSDADGVPDPIDNCPLSVNEQQRDEDGDGVGDVCDVDRDGDGIPNGHGDKDNDCDGFADGADSDCKKDGGP